MSQFVESDRSRAFYPSLEGIRGYSFLTIFLAHYCDASFANIFLWWSYPLHLLKGIDWALMPIFFVLSGFLICGILLDTREREGYFKIFYSRRILRVFPFITSRWRAWELHAS